MNWAFVICEDVGSLEAPDNSEAQVSPVSHCP